MYRNVLHVHVSGVHNGKCISHLHGIHSKLCCRKCISWAGGTADLQGLWDTNCVNDLITYHNLNFCMACVHHNFGFYFISQLKVSAGKFITQARFPLLSLFFLLLLLLLLSSLLIQIPAIITYIQHLYVHNCMSSLL